MWIKKIGENIDSYLDLFISDNYDNKASTAIDYSDINEVVEEETDKSFAFVGLYICWLLPSLSVIIHL
ncbi:MAG: hypothetical protein PSN35_07620 [Candidatus Thioglobus sp.]|uniref:hypothetical protein n=1 Tax=Candidatus Thioglobus sp. TaxID=2026721 RepID=UPI002637E1AA|nr:hypothetical protein [Candidatus Thioglobus sp.]MDC9727681.1 hypothetical protein [Candidatus Thioglobus sp.]